MNKYQAINKIIEILEDSEMSENMDNYESEDGWGPALGFAAKEAEKHNKGLKKLIKFAKEIKAIYKGNKEEI